MDVRPDRPGPMRAVGVNNLLFQGTQALYEMEGIGGPDALAVSAYEQLLDAAGVTRQWGWLTLIPEDRLTDLAPLLDLLNVGMLVVRQRPALADHADAADDGDPWIDVVTRPTAWPRAFFVDGVTPYDHARDLIERVRVEARPLAGIERTDLEAAALAGLLPPTPTTVVPADGYQLTTNTTSFRIAAPGPGVAVLTETYLPLDFRATLDGQPVPYFRVNHAFKGVVIPAAGTYTVRFEYRPARWELAWWGAGAGALAVVGFVLGGLPRRRRVPPASRRQGQPSANDAVS
jgi:hypothetical protein